MTDRLIRIGGASGAWGDSPGSIGQLLSGGVDYLVMDLLAEVTMSLLARARMKSPDAGYTPDFVEYLKPHLQQISDRGVKVVSNAGGVNPLACKRALEAASAEAGVKLQIAVVTGDDLLPELRRLQELGIREWSTGEPIPEVMTTANAYLGALPVAAALAAGADIVITGRCADSALALGVLLHEFDWKTNDYDRLAAGSLVGHVLECGPQATGGLFTDWENVPGWDCIGYPIAECSADGTFVLTKPVGTGGLVQTECVAEQILYEVGDPRAYILPDVVADFSGVYLTQQASDRVLVQGARGRHPTSQYKVSGTYQDGWRATALVVIIGHDAVRKAERAGQALIERTNRLLAEVGQSPIKRTHIEALGGEASYLAQARARDTREVVLRLVVDHDDPKALAIFAREIASSGLSFAQGTAALIGGRPKPTPVIRLFTFLVEKEQLPQPEVQVGAGNTIRVQVPTSGGYVPPGSQHVDGKADDGESVVVPLRYVAYARSGDKGNISNIGIFCRRSEYRDHLAAILTPDLIAQHFTGVVAGKVTRFEAPGLCAFNFLMEDALGGGGMASMRIDPLGKSFGQRLLELEVSVPARWLGANQH